MLLVAAVWLSWRFAWRQLANKADEVLCADLGYWVCMFLAGTLGTVIGDYSSHNLKLDDAGAAILLSPIVALLFVAGRNGSFCCCHSSGRRWSRSAPQAPRSATLSPAATCSACP